MAGEIKFEDTNVALIGSELDMKARIDAGQTEEAWKDAGKKPELKVWRIANFKVIPVESEDYGKFYSGDSYIVLHTYKKPEKDTLYHDIHFWLGAETSQDESGTAAYKTVELDDFLGTMPVQHRQVEGSETDLFLSYFKPFIVLKGGVASGFNQVKKGEHQNRLLRVHFSKSAGGLIVREVSISYKSLNSGDVFVFDGGNEIIQWNGNSANGMEKVKAAEYVRRLDDSRPSQKTNIVVVDQGDKDSAKFFKAIGGEGPIAAPQEMTKENFVLNLYRLSDSSGKMVFQNEVEGTIPKSCLDTNDVFILDYGTGLFIWVGKNAAKEERREAMGTAIKYLEFKNRDSKLPITRVLDGQETEAFKKLLS